MNRSTNTACKPEARLTTPLDGTVASSKTFYSRCRKIVPVLAAYVILVALPPILLHLGLPLKLAQIHDIIFSCALVAISAFLLIRGKAKSDLIVTTSYATAALLYLQLIDLASSQVNAVDYMLVVVAAMSFVQHGSPYFTGTNYVLYPPLYAETFAVVYNCIAGGGQLLGYHLTQTSVWLAVQYLFQNALLASVLLLMAVSHRFCRQIGNLPKLRSTLLTLALIVPSAAVFWTVRKYQTNIFVTDLTMLAMLFVDSSPALAALSAVLGANIKVYPGLICVAWMFGKRYKACAWAALWFGLLAILETAYIGRPTLWAEYFITAKTYISALPVSVPKWLLGSPNLLNETYRFLAAVGQTQYTLPQIANMVHVEQALIVGWFVWRFKNAPNMVGRLKETADSIAHLPLDQAVIIERSCDLLTLMLLIGSTVLSDHFVLAIPIAIWTVLLTGRRRPWIVPAGIALVLAWQFKAVVPLHLEPLGLLLLTLARSTALVGAGKDR